MRQAYADEQWICCECAESNTLRRERCKECNKPRWAQLGFDSIDRAYILRKRESSVLETDK